MRYFFWTLLVFGASACTSTTLELIQSSELRRPAWVDSSMRAKSMGLYVGRSDVTKADSASQSIHEVAYLRAIDSVLKSLGAVYTGESFVQTSQQTTQNNEGGSTYTKQDSGSNIKRAAKRFLKVDENNVKYYWEMYNKSGESFVQVWSAIPFDTKQYTAAQNALVLQFLKENLTKIKNASKDFEAGQVANSFEALLFVQNDLKDYDGRNNLEPSLLAKLTGLERKTRDQIVSQIGRIRFLPKKANVELPTGDQVVDEFLGKLVLKKSDGSLVAVANLPVDIDVKGGYRDHVRTASSASGKLHYQTRSPRGCEGPVKISLNIASMFTSAAGLAPLKQTIVGSVLSVDKLASVAINVSAPDLGNKHLDKLKSDWKSILKEAGFKRVFMGQNNSAMYSLDLKANVHKKSWLTERFLTVDTSMEGALIERANSTIVRTIEYPVGSCLGEGVGGTEDIALAAGFSIDSCRSELVSPLRVFLEQSSGDAGAGACLGQ